MEKSIEDVCEQLDSLALRSLELMEEKVCANIQLERLVREGHIELAKARYIRGRESIGSLQIPQDCHMNSLFELETNMTKKGETDVPSFDISLKSVRETKENNEQCQDPIKWFGVLVPQSLRMAQKRFQESLYTAVKVANINSELETIPSQLESLKTLKNTLAK